MPPVKPQSPPRPEDRFPIRLLRGVNTLFTRCYHHLDVLSPPRLPRTGPAIIVSNHVSGLDPLLIQAPCNRLITWMMAAEYFDIKPLAPIFRTLGVIPVRRGDRDSSSLRAALRALESGRILGIFPEGRINETQPHGLLPFQTGVALIAIRTGLPVIPVYLDGSQRGKDMLPAFLSPNRAVLRFGTPLTFPPSHPSRDALESATAAIRDAVLDLQRQTLSDPIIPLRNRFPLSAGE